MAFRRLPRQDAQGTSGSYAIATVSLAGFDKLYAVCVLVNGTGSATPKCPVYVYLRDGTGTSTRMIGGGWCRSSGLGGAPFVGCDLQFDRPIPLMGDECVSTVVYNYDTATQTFGTVVEVET